VAKITTLEENDLEAPKSQKNYRRSGSESLTQAGTRHAGAIKKKLPKKVLQFKNDIFLPLAKDMEELSRF
jgi:hypothetical protein